MTMFCPMCGRIAEYYPNNDGTYCTCCRWYQCGNQEISYTSNTQQFYEPNKID